MTIHVILGLILAASLWGLWRLSRRPTPNPMEERQTVDWEELKAMWPHDAGSPE